MEQNVKSELKRLAVQRADARAKLAAMLEVATDPADHISVWQGPQARMYARITVAELQALCRQAHGEVVAGEALAHLREVLADASSRHLDLGCWMGPSMGYSPKITAGELALLAGVEVRNG
jgi:hypothetical protein